MIYVIVFLAGLINAWVWTQYTTYIIAKDRMWAGVFDLALLSLQYGMLQVWAMEGNNPCIPFAWIISNAIGTIYAVGRKHD